MTGLIVRKSKIAWIGHKSWLHDPSGIIYSTRDQARFNGWKSPSKVKITLLKEKKK